MVSPAIEVARILRVDHAGEKGAIGIYTVQILVSRLLWPDCVPQLREMLSHERRHLQVFTAALKARQLRSCYALPLWSLGGYMLGLITALLGRRAIWSCTAAVEATVYRHIQAQKSFLAMHDHQALEAVASIEQDEKSHLDHALSQGGEPMGSGRFVWFVVANATAVAIWLSERF